LGDPPSALGEGEAAGLDAAAQAGQAADVADGVGGDGAAACGEAEHAGQSAAACLRGGDAAVRADGGDELVHAGHCGFTEPECTDSGKDVAVEVVAVEPGGVGRLGAVDDVLSNVGVPAFGEVADRSVRAEAGAAAGWRTFGQCGLEGTFGGGAAACASFDEAELPVGVADVGVG
jgi:hypothetical protein